MDWKSAVRSVAPGLATLMGGPLAGGVVTLLADKLLGASTGTREGDEAAISRLLEHGATPEIRAKIIEAEAALKQEMIRAGVREKEIAAETERAYIGDAAHARQTHMGNKGILWLGVSINIMSYTLVAAVLVGSFALLTGALAPNIEPTLSMAVGSIVGATVQWVVSNAAQANGYFFGSSPGSRLKDEALKDAIERVSVRR